jgi:hypothetical protein
MYTIDLQKRFKDAFGFVANNATGRAAGIGLNGNLFYTRPAQINAETVQEREPVSNYDAPVYQGELTYDVLTFSHPQLGERELELVVMLDLKRQKQLTVTQINQQQEVNLPQGEVVENWAIAPWTIRLKGLVVDMEAKQYPLQEVKRLNTLFSLNDTIECSSELLTALHIYHVYLTDFGFVRENAFPDSQAFTLTMKSHAPAEALIL